MNCSEWKSKKFNSSKTTKGIFKSNFRTFPKFNINFQLLPSVFKVSKLNFESGTKNTPALRHKITETSSSQTRPKSTNVFSTIQQKKWRKWILSSGKKLPKSISTKPSTNDSKWNSKKTNWVNNKLINMKPTWKRSATKIKDSMTSSETDSKRSKPGKINSHKLKSSSHCWLKPKINQKI